VRLCMIGTGYVGLVSGACFADIGHQVICVDNDQEKIKMLVLGRIPIYEPGLEELVKRNLKKKSISFTTSIAEGTKKSQVIFIAVGTPPKDCGEPDLSAVEQVSQEIGMAMGEYKLIVEKSTVPVQTGKWVRTTIQRFNRSGVDFDVASNPEFLREGSAIDDFLHPDRVVLGVENDRAKQLMLEIYEPIGGIKIVTDIESAELIKHASNSFLSMKISFINAISRICELTGADVVKVSDGMGLDKRIGREFLNAGAGFGGFCFPKDLKAFIGIAKRLGYDFNLLKEVENINSNQQRHIVDKLEKLLWNIKDKTVGILGLSFKPDTDDMRYAPSITIIEMLQTSGARIKAYDPVAMDKAKLVLKNVEFCPNPYKVAEAADAIMLVTEWSEFKDLDFARIKKSMRQPVILDGRNMFDPQEIRGLGFIYEGIGR